MSDLGQIDIQNWEIRSIWGRYSLKWGYLGQFTKLPETTMPPDQFYNGDVQSSQIYGREQTLNS